jgi:hypothetical protein
MNLLFIFHVLKFFVLLSPITPNPVYLFLILDNLISGIASSTPIVNKNLILCASLDKT